MWLELLITAVCGSDSGVPDLGPQNLVHFADYLPKSFGSGGVQIEHGPEKCILCRVDVNGSSLHKRPLHLIGILTLL